MTFFLVALVIGLFILAGVLASRIVVLKGNLVRFQGIQDIEDHLRGCQAQVASATQTYQNLQLHIAEMQQQVAGYQRVLGPLKNAHELQERIARDTAIITHKQTELQALARSIDSLRSASEIISQVTYYQNYLEQLKADVASVEEKKSLQEFGFYQPRYNFETSDEYQSRLDSIYSRQKTMLSNKLACSCNTEWTVDGDRKEGKRMVEQQIKLMLRAFNGECDAAIAKARYNNVVALENRMSRTFQQISKLGEAKHIHLSPEYYNLKLQELHLSYEWEQKKQEEKETQKQIRDQMREEEKVSREVEAALERTEQEEAAKERALEQARSELAKTTGEQTARLEELVARLENELHEVLDRKAKAIARAQLTKSGHVYILSNIGSFGEGVYKIGMSRRLEPLERVDELGGAGVPFPFDVHAMIYSENAPELENILHQHFASRRVNLVNLRREFFRVSLDEIRAAVAKHFGNVTFVTEPEAEQYRQSVAKLKAVPLGELQIA